MLRKRLFDGVEENLTVYNAQAIINLEFEFFTDECPDDLIDSEVDFTFPNFDSAYFRVFNERGGRRIKNLVMTQADDVLVLNASVADMTFEDFGNYYYEIGYVANTYEIALTYGILKVI